MEEDLVEIITRKVIKSEKIFVDKFIDDHFPKCDKELVLEDLKNIYVTMNYKKLFEYTLNEGGKATDDIIRDIVEDNTYNMIVDLYNK